LELYYGLVFHDEFSSSSSSSLWDLSFIFEQSSDDVPILDYVLDSEIGIKTLELVMKLRQANKRAGLRHHPEDHEVKKFY